VKTSITSLCALPHAKAARCRLELPFKSSNETGSVLVAYRGSDLLHAHVGVCQQVRSALKSSLCQHVAKPDSGGLFEKALQVGMAEVKRKCPIVDRTERILLH